jgi:hypothetical protein
MEKGVTNFLSHINCIKYISIEDYTLYRTNKAKIIVRI